MICFLSIDLQILVPIPFFFIPAFLFHLSHFVLHYLSPFSSPSTPTHSLSFSLLFLLDHYSSISYSSFFFFRSLPLISFLFSQYPYSFFCLHPFPVSLFYPLLSAHVESTLFFKNILLHPILPPILILRQFLSYPLFLINGTSMNAATDFRPRAKLLNRKKDFLKERFYLSISISFSITSTHSHATHTSISRTKKKNLQEKQQQQKIKAKMKDHRL